MIYEFSNFVDNFNHADGRHPRENGYYSIF